MQEQKPKKKGMNNMEKNNKKMATSKKVQILRRMSQFIFFGLLIAGVYMDLRMVIIAFLPASLLFGNFFCGWACPYGSIQELMGNIWKKIFKKQYKMPRKIQKYLQYTRYVLFVIVIIGVLDFIMTPINGYGTFLGLFSEEMMTALSVVALVIMGIYLLMSMVFERAFCNYLCTESAKYGVLSMARIFSIKRNTDTCISCKKCDKACPMNIEVSVHEQVRNGQCINCFKCIDVCPVKDTLGYKKVGWNLKRKMKKRIKISLIIVGVIVIAFVGLVGSKFIMTYQEGINMLTGERVNADEYIAANSAAPDVVIDEEELFSERDLIQVPNLEEAKALLVSNGKDIVVKEEGTYLVSGTYTDSMIIIDGDDKAKVQLVFDNVSITNESKPVIYVKAGNKVYITTTDSENYIGVTGEFVPDGDINLDAVIFSRTDLVFNGVGTLRVSSLAGNGISTKDNLKITGGHYKIHSVEHGLEANDSIRIYDGKIEIDSEEDGMHCVNKEDEDKGYIFIENGDINIIAGDDAIRGNSSVTINNGVINIESCQEGIEATQIRINDGEITLYAMDDGINATAKTVHRIVAEVNGGSVKVTMANGDTDGIDSNGDFTINGGEIIVEGGMAAFDIDAIIAFNGGKVIVDGEEQTEIVTQQIGFASKLKSN